MICTIPRRGVDIILVFPHFREAIDSELASPTPAMKLGMVVVAEGYLTANVAEGLKTPKAAKPSDRSRLRRVTLAEYLRAWTAVDERERLAFDLVTFCGLRESEVYGLKIGDLFQRGAIKVQRSWYAGEVNPTKTNQIRDVGVELEILERLMAWIANSPDRDEGWVFASERIVTPLPPENVLQHCIHPRLDPLRLGWITFAVLRRSHSTLHQERGTDHKITADQQGHGLGVHLSDYVTHRSHVSRRHPRYFGRISRRCNPFRRRAIETNETRADSARRAKQRKHGAGGDTSTHGRQLGKLRPIVDRPTTPLSYLRIDV
jgi:hypothetical protein